MPDHFPVAEAILPHDPPLTGYFPREREIEEIVKYLEKMGQAAVWAPRYSGRTTFLHLLEEKLSNSADFKIAIYVWPDRDIDPTHQEPPFYTFAKRIVERVKLDKVKLKELDIYDWEKPEVFLDFLRDLVTLSDHAIAILLDDCDKLPPVFLVTLLHDLREAFRKRQDPLQGHLWRRISFVVAGAVSFRSLKLLQEKELSPFDDWELCRLRDLSADEAGQYLRDAFLKLKIEIEENAIAAIIEHAGGDLWRLNAISQRLAQPGYSVDRVAVELVMEQLTNNYSDDPSVAYMLSVLTHDPLCLEVVDRLLREPYRGETEFFQGDLHPLQDQNVKISNQELSGGIILIRGSDDSPLGWRARNGFCREILRRHFTPQRLVRAFLDLGQYHRAERHIDRLGKQLADDFREQITRFDEAGVRDIVEWCWNYRREDEDPTGEGRETHAERKRRRRSVDRVGAGFKGLDFILREVFGFGEFTLYDVNNENRRLVPNEFLLPAERLGEDKQGGINFADSIEDLTSEERVFRSGVYSVEITSEPQFEGDSRLKIVMPLRSFEGKVTGVLSLNTRDYLAEWAILFVRIPIVERAVNFVWRRLSRYRAEFHKALRKIMEDRRAGDEEDSKRDRPLWLAAKFETEILRYFKEKNRDLPTGFALNPLEFKGGSIFTRVKSAIVKSDSFVVFDLSHLSDSVLFEVGLAIGAHRPGLLLRHKGRRESIPELLVDRIFGEYDLQEPLGESFSGPLLDAWEDYQRYRAKKGYNFLLRCGCEELPGSDDDSFILVIDHDEYSDRIFFRRIVEEAVPRGKKVIYLWEREGLNAAVLSRGDHDRLTGIYQIIDAAELIIARVERLEERADDAARFVATGMAMGIEIRKKKSNVLLAAVRRDGKVDVATDLNGSNYIDFEEHTRLRLAQAIDGKLGQMKSTNNKPRSPRSN